MIADYYSALSSRGKKEENHSSGLRDLAVPYIICII